MLALLRLKAKSFRYKIYITLSCCSVVGIFILGIISYETAKKNLIEKTMETANQAIHQTSSKLDVIYSNYDKLSMKIATDSSLIESFVLRSQYANVTLESLQISRPILQSLQEYLYTYKYITSITITSLDKKTVLSTDSNIDSNSQILDSALKSRMNANPRDAVWITTERSDKGKKTTNAVIVRPIFRDSTLVGYLLVEIDSRLFIPELKDIDQFFNHRLLMIAPGNDILYQGDGEFSDFPSYEEMFPHSTEMQSQKHRKLLLYDKSDINQWGLIALLPESALTSGLREMFVYTILAAILAILMSVSAGLWFAGRILKPMVVLRDHMLSGSRGNLSIRMTHITNDEIGESGHAFNLMMDRINALIGDLAEQSQLAMSDTLTQLANQRALRNAWDELASLPEPPRPTYLALLDIDHFKRINDTFGHDIGDILLQRIAKVLKENENQHITVYRYGGEEFAILFKEIPSYEVYDKLESIRVSISQIHHIEINGQAISVSIGFAEATLNNTFITAFKDADIQLYRVKRNGRNRTLPELSKCQ
jgi:diguanylate cyclase (GGDEF)-like protein